MARYGQYREASIRVILQGLDDCGRWVLAKWWPFRERGRVPLWNSRNSCGSWQISSLARFAWLPIEA
jgi:hypothetical protein